MEDVRNKLVEIFTEQFGEEIAKAAQDGGEIFVDHGRGWANGSLDSLDKVEFVMAVEDAFKVEIADYQIEGFRSLDDVAKFVHALTSDPKHGAH